jgi:GNAT superfamily N-acetyltransferase
LSLICALANFESLPPPDAGAQARFVRDGWPETGERPLFEAWIVESEESGEGEEPATGPGPRPVGYAITFTTYSSFLARPTLYIEDIFVLPSHRRRDLGSALMRRLVREALERDCGRMDWVVLDWNVGAQQFYRRLGASHLAEWQCYRLRREEMESALGVLNDTA